MPGGCCIRIVKAGSLDEARELESGGLNDLLLVLRSWTA